MGFQPGIITFRGSQPAAKARFVGDRDTARTDWVGTVTGKFLEDNLLTLIFGTLGFITSVIAIFYAKRSHALQKSLPSETTSRSVSVFWTREGMIRHLLAQYDKAKSGEEIWAQTIGLTNFPGSVEEKVLKAAARGVKFRYIVSKSNPDRNSFVSLFSSINNAQIAQSDGNRVRIQGLSEREVIIAFPTITTYTAIKVTDSDFVGIMRSWFDERWNESATNGILKD